MADTETVTSESTQDEAPIESYSEERQALIERLGNSGTPAQAAETTEDPKPAKAEEPKAEKAKPDKTADDDRFEKMAKALQKSQQDIASLTRKLDENGKLTAKETAKLEAAKTNVDELAELLNPDHAIDYTEDLRKGWKKTKDHEDRLSKLEKENAELRESQEKREAQEGQNKAFWKQEAKTYEGVDVKQIWENSLDAAWQRPAVKRAFQLVDAKKISKQDCDEIYQAEAADIYQERVKTAKASRDGKAAKEPQTARRTPASPPNGAQAAHDAGANSPATPFKRGPSEPDMEVISRLGAARL